MSLCRLRWCVRCGEGWCASGEGHTGAETGSEVCVYCNGDQAELTEAYYQLAYAFDTLDTSCQFKLKEWIGRRRKHNATFRALWYSGIEKAIRDKRNGVYICRKIDIDPFLKEEV